MSSSLTSERVREIFTPLGTGKAAEFFAHVEPTVKWTIANPNPGSKSNDFSGEYNGLQAFGPVAGGIYGNLAEPLLLKIVSDPIVSGKRAVIEFRTAAASGELAKGKNGASFDNYYCFVVEFGDNDKIHTIRTYLDTAQVRDITAK